MEKKIEIRIGFLAFVCILGWLDIRICGWFLFAMTMHEMAHLLVIRLYGIPVDGVSVRLSGAVIRCGICSYRQEAVCAAAGPASNLLLCILTIRAIPKLAVVSGVLGFGNLLPVYPLDGGRILRGFLMSLLPENRVYLVLSRVSCVCCCLLMACACWVTAELQMGIWPVFAALAVLWRVGMVKWADI